MARRERPFKGRQFTSEVILWAGEHRISQDKNNVLEQDHPGMQLCQDFD